MQISSTQVSHDLSLLKTAYQIGRSIHTHVRNNSSDHNEEPWSEYMDRFNWGLDPFFNQTKAGLILEVYNGMPSIIHTPFGQWQILGSGSGNVDKVMEAIKEPLGLKLIQGLKLIKKGKYTRFVRIGPFYAITKWDGKKIVKLINRKKSEFIPLDTVVKIWKNFASYPELNDRKFTIGAHRRPDYQIAG